MVFGGFFIGSLRFFVGFSKVLPPPQVISRGLLVAKRPTKATYWQVLVFLLGCDRVLLLSTGRCVLGHHSVFSQSPDLLFLLG